MLLTHVPYSINIKIMTIIPLKNWFSSLGIKIMTIIQLKKRLDLGKFAPPK